MFHPFQFTIGQILAIHASHEHGECVGRSEYPTSEPQYLLRYAAADGRACEAWWQQSALYAHDAVHDGQSALHAPETSRTTVLTPPAIGGTWYGQGGIYAGVARRRSDSEHDYHLILCASAPTDSLNWSAAMAWAARLDDNHHHDWALPTRPESALLLANLRDQFDPSWHWTSEQYSRDNAWVQYFVDGRQPTYDKSYEGRARAVRRLVIQPFINSTAGQA